jgi:hypothetical protein
MNCRFNSKNGSFKSLGFFLGIGSCKLKTTITTTKFSWALLIYTKIIGTPEHAIQRIVVQSQFRKKVHEIPSQIIAEYGGACLSFQLWQET